MDGFQKRHSHQHHFHQMLRQGTPKLWTHHGPHAFETKKSRRRARAASLTATFTSLTHSLTHLSGLVLGPSEGPHSDSGGLCPLWPRPKCSAKQRFEFQDVRWWCIVWCRGHKSSPLEAQYSRTIGQVEANGVSNRQTLAYFLYPSCVLSNLGLWFFFLHLQKWKVWKTVWWPKIGRPSVSHHSKRSKIL